MKRALQRPTIPEPPANSLERTSEIQRLHELLPTLGDEEITAIYFRFWESLLIAEVANILGRSWNYTDRLIERSIQKLRRDFVEIPTKRTTIAA